MKAFTEEQRMVVRHGQGHALVNAVAGAGKSTTLIESIARRVAEGAEAKRIRAIMFNKEAQLSFQAKLAERLPNIQVKAQTFHSVGLEIMKRLQQSGLLPATTQASERELLRLSRRALRDAWEATGERSNTLPYTADDEFTRFITLVKANIVSPERVFEKYSISPMFRCFPDAFARFEAARVGKRKHGFDDMIYGPVMRMLADPALQVPFTNHLTHLYVDEFQDTNQAQFALLRIIAGTRASVIVVGDVDQAIYGWRGAEPSLILGGFEAVFKPCTRYAMTRNFRYGHRVALIGNHIITNNLERDDKITVSTEDNKETRVHVIPEASLTDSGIVSLARVIGEEGRFDDAMMLVRSYSQSVRYEVELMAEQIPFFVYGRAPLLRLDEIAAQVAVLCLAAGQWCLDENDSKVSFLMSMFRVPSIYLIAEEQQELTERLAGALENPRTIPKLVKDFAMSLKGDRSRVIAPLMERADAIETLVSGRLAKSSPDTILGTYDAMTQLTGWLERQRAQGPTGAEIAANVQAFRDVAKRKSDLIELIEQLGPMAGSKAMEPPEYPHFKITSVHRSKGSEYPIVIVGGWVDGAFPSPNAPIEEERRLAYVAVTRAMEQLILMTPACPMLAEELKTVELVEHPPNIRPIASPFLFEAEIALSDRVADAISASDARTFKARKARVANRYLTATGRETMVSAQAEERPAGARPIYHAAQIAIGAKVWHAAHGRGVVDRNVYGPVYTVVTKKSGPVSVQIDGGDWYLV